MLLARLLMLFISTSCSTLSHVESVPYEGAVYVVDVKNGGAQRSSRIVLDCKKPENLTLCYVPFELMDNFVCFAPEDAGPFLRR